MLAKLQPIVTTVKPTITGLGSFGLLSIIPSHDESQAICQSIVTLVTVIAQLVNIFKSFKKKKNV